MTVSRAARAILTTLLVGTAPSLALAQANPDAPPSAGAPEANALPDPATDKQDPPPVTESPKPYPGPPRSEVGADFGMVSRPASGDPLVHYPMGWGAGAHVRIDILDWLGARIATRFESTHAAFDEGALNLPPGTVIDQPHLRRINISLQVEPGWRPVPRLLLFVGVGAGWGRTTAESMHTTGAESVRLPSRSAVFVELPVSIGARFEIVPGLLVVNLKGSVAPVYDQSGRMLKPYDTPNKDGTMVQVGPMPELGTSFALLTGLGVLL